MEGRSSARGDALRPAVDAEGAALPPASAGAVEPIAHFTTNGAAIVNAAGADSSDRLVQLRLDCERFRVLRPVMRKTIMNVTMVVPVLITVRGCCAECA